MKRLFTLTASFSLGLLLPVLAAEAPDPNRQQEQQVLAIVSEVQAQQAAIAENMAKMDAKLATIAESLRIARIYATRGGGGNK